MLAVAGGLVTAGFRIGWELPLKRLIEPLGAIWFLAGVLAWGAWRSGKRALLFASAAMWLILTLAGNPWSAAALTALCQGPVHAVEPTQVGPL